MKPQIYDRYNAELFCQHCGHYFFTTRVGIDHDQLPAVRADLRREAQAHSNAIGREVEITLYLTLERRVWFLPKPQRTT